MDKPRLPFDIEFLLESVLSETPDAVIIDRIEAERLNALGLTHIKKGGFSHRRFGTGFFIDVKNGVVAYSRETHGYIQEFLIAAMQEAVVRPNDFNSIYSVYEEIPGTISIVKPDAKATVSLFGLVDRYNNPSITIRKYLRENIQFYRNLNVRGKVKDAPGKIARATVPSGRIWTKKYTVSFWNDKSTLHPHLDLIFKFMNSLGVDEHKCIYQFLDFRGFFAYSELTGEVGEREKLSSDEMDKLRRIIHTLSPKEKKAALMKLGADHSKAGEIANKLGMSAAEYNHIMNVNEDSTMPSLSEIVSSINTSK
jgi:hypothetical protein